jgi:predicted helicase
VYQHVFISTNIIESSFVSNKTSEITSAFPLYLYPTQTDLLNTARTPNLDPKIVEKIAAAIGLEFEPEKSGEAGNRRQAESHRTCSDGQGAKEESEAKFAPIDLLDYIYAVLHSPAYREKYKEFLKIDFPRVPYPAGADEFRRLAALGSELRRLHLMEHPALSGVIGEYPFPVAGSNIVEKLRWEPNADGTTGRVWINGDQYFDSVPVAAWNFYIGGYQPAQKWLKDRTTRTLSFDDILHYQRIIKSLGMTEAIMKMI